MITPPKRRYHAAKSIDDQGPIPLTPDAHARMKARLARLKKQIPALAAEAGEAAAQGDRSDNAGYKEAKGLLRRATRQILTLEDQLKRVIEIAPGAGADGTVRIGSTVALETIDDGITKKVTYEILGPFETDPAAGRISYKSPLGAALMGKSNGEIVRIAAAGKAKEYKIISVK
jgi:transcription elongation GreA/GreB family factor